MYNSTIKAKVKPCKSCGEDKRIFALGLCGFCYQLEQQEKQREKAKNQNPIKKVSPIKKYSDKHLKRLAKYRKLRDKYLSEHPVCEVDDCSNRSNQLHHKKGRDGEMLIAIEFFMACCGVCHPRRIHETEVEWAKEKGYLLRRN